MNIIERIRLSIFPGGQKPADEQKGHRRYFRSLLLHFRPRVVPERTLRFSLTWGLGGMAALLVFLLFGTGLMLKFVYEPFPGRAYDSILHLQQNIPFGQLIRNIHHWSANGLLIIAFLHFLRVFFTGAFVAPRQFNWIIGLALFAAVLLSNFTGYLLPWDQLAFWAITISSSMLEYIPGVGTWLQELILGGKELGPATIANFYAFHTAILPALLLLIMPFHFWRIRKAKGLVIPKLPDENTDTVGEKVDTIPNLIVREVSVALVLLAIILVISMLFNAPLAAKANPGLSPNPTKAPWYFMGIQEMLMHFHPVFSLFIFPLMLVFGLLFIPYLNYESETAGVWFCSNKGRKMALIAVVTSIAATVAAIFADEFIVSSALVGPPNIILSGLVPFVLVLAGCIGFYVVMKKRFGAVNNEAVQALFILLVTAFLVLTIVGIWFRGTGMQLMWGIWG
jgi:quinol-cytochrome oxidoreductase complex cytochrome b subunit